MHSWQICSPHSQVQQNEGCFLQQQHSYCSLCRLRLRLESFRLGSGMGRHGRTKERGRGSAPSGASPRPVIKKRGRYSSQFTTTSDPSNSKGGR